jgi:RNA polymerase subunit RPABC4/transcription elongation factor Spt4
MTRWGKLLVVMGLMSFILALFGFEFRLVRLFGGGPGGAAFIAIVGGILWAIGAARERKSAAPMQMQPTQPAQLTQLLPPTQTALPFHPVQPPPIATLPLINLGQRCTRCGQVVPTGAAFCGECGNAVAAAPVARYCPNCGRTIVAGKNFCTNCGTRLTA